MKTKPEEQEIKNDMMECHGATANIEPFGEENKAYLGQATRPID
jgi:hypothetical protein